MSLTKKMLPVLVMLLSTSCIKKESLSDSDQATPKQPRQLIFADETEPVSEKQSDAQQTEKPEPLDLVGVWYGRSGTEFGQPEYHWEFKLSEERFSIRISNPEEEFLDIIRGTWTRIGDHPEFRLCPDQFGKYFFPGSEETIELYGFDPGYLVWIQNQKNHEQACFHVTCCDLVGAHHLVDVRKRLPLVAPRP